MAEIAESNLNSQNLAHFDISKAVVASLQDDPVIPSSWSYTFAQSTLTLHEGWSVWPTGLGRGDDI